MKNLVMAAVLGLLLVSANAPAEASTPESAIGSQVEVVEVMHRSPFDGPRGPHGPHGPRGPHGPHGPRGPHGSNGYWR